MPDLSQKELIDLNTRIGQAEKDGDLGFLDQCLADALSFRRANGTVVNKQTYLDAVAKTSYDRLESEELEVLPYGTDTALVSLRVAAKGTRDNNQFAGIFRNTRVFLKLEDRWQCALWFNTLEEDLP